MQLARLRKFVTSISIIGAAIWIAVRNTFPKISESVSNSPLTDSRTGVRFSPRVVANSSIAVLIPSTAGWQISAIEEIAYLNGWITKKELQEAANIYGNSSYGMHLQNVVDGKYRY